jgi:hypothetical protein
VREGPSKLAAAAWQTIAPADTDADSVVTTTEFLAWQPTGTPRDFDGDRVIRPWEAAAGAKLAQLEANNPTALDTAPIWRDNLPWPIDRAGALGIPWLALFGGLDNTSIHGPMIKEWSARNNITNVSVEYFLVPRERGQQMKDVAQLDGWFRDGSRDYVEKLCDFG